MACVLAHEKYGILVCAIILGSYIVIGGWFLIFLIRNIKTTTTKTENL